MKQANYEMKVLNLTCIFNAYVFRNLHVFFISHILLFLVDVIALFLSPNPFKLLVLLLDAPCSTARNCLDGS